MRNALVCEVHAPADILYTHTDAFEARALGKDEGYQLFKCFRLFPASPDGGTLAAVMPFAWAWYLGIEPGDEVTIAVTKRANVPEAGEFRKIRDSVQAAALAIGTHKDTP